MEIVIDAQVVSAYFQESALELPAPAGGLTDSATLVFERVGTHDRAFLDEGGQIKQEWRNLVQPEWFDVWYADLIRDDAAIEIAAPTCESLRQALKSKGFPQGSRDFWYVRTAKAVLNRYGQAVIVSEDMDLHDPIQKKVETTHRGRILRSGNGSVAKFLQRRENIAVVCVAAYLQLVDNEENGPVGYDCQSS